MERLEYAFFHRECPEVARDLVGKLLIRQTDAGRIQMRIAETEAYCGEADTACHAHRGRTQRTEVLYGPAGTIYVYLCYGIHWLLNIVTGEVDEPQAVLIRACVEAYGPGKLTKALDITGVWNRRCIWDQEELWIADDGFRCEVLPDRRVGIGYASPADQARLWRFRMEDGHR